VLQTQLAINTYLAGGWYLINEKMLLEMWNDQILRLLCGWC